MLIVLIEGTNEVSPFTYSLDQSIPCPTGCGQDYAWIDDLEDAETIDLNFDWIQTFLDQKIEELGSPSAGIVVSSW